VGLVLCKTLDSRRRHSSSIIFKFEAASPGTGGSAALGLLSSLPPGTIQLNRQNRQNRGADRHAGRRQRGPSGERREPIHLTSEGVPSATPDAPKPSPVVFVSHESRTRHAWLPERAIAGSVWRGPSQERVQIDESGNALPWRTGRRRAS